MGKQDERIGEGKGRREGVVYREKIRLRRMEVGKKEREMIQCREEGKEGVIKEKRKGKWRGRDSLPAEK